MNIVFDFTHPAHVNLFKNVIKRLVEDGHNVYCIVLNRGRLPSILRDELPFIQQEIIGERPNSRVGIIVESNLKRVFKLYKKLKCFKPDIGISSGSIPFSLALKALGKPSLHFSDDPERKISTFLELLTSTKKFYPPFEIKSLFFKNRISHYNSLKQWAYLSPKYFSPNSNALRKYSLEPFSYFFVREISTSSLNYNNQEKEHLINFVGTFPATVKVLFSLEEKTLREKYPTNWIMIEEPEKNIHSLIYFSKAVISTGDSMAREGGMLGVPSFYCGTRNMKANQVLIKKNILKHILPSELSEQLSSHTNSRNESLQLEFISQLENEWGDLNEFIINKIFEYV